MAKVKNRKIYLKWFRLEEFNSPDDPLSYKQMEEELLKRLDFARELAKCSFKITSGFRTKEHNRKVGGVMGSSHCKGLAADIYIKDNDTRYRILDALFKARFNRFGIGENFIHVDIDPDKAKHRIWTYNK